MATISEDAVRTRAYQLWEEGGRIDGDHEEHWRRAQAECATAGDAAGAVDGMDGASAAAPSGIDGALSESLIGAKSKPRRWPTPIIDV